MTAIGIATALAISQCFKPQASPVTSCYTQTILTQTYLSYSFILLSETVLKTCLGLTNKHKSNKQIAKETDMITQNLYELLPFLFFLGGFSLLMVIYLISRVE